MRVSEGVLKGSAWASNATLGSDRKSQNPESLVADSE